MSMSRGRRGCACTRRSSNWIRSNTASDIKQDASTLAAIGWGRGKSSHTGCQTPLLNIGFNEYETCLTKVDMNAARTVRAYCGKQVPATQTNKSVLGLATVAGIKYSSSSWAVTNTEDIALLERRAEGCCGEGVVV
jgi:hypothetical protein